MTDTRELKIEDHGSIVLIRAHSARAQAWLEDHTTPEAMWYMGALVAEPRYVAPLLQGAHHDGIRI